MERPAGDEAPAAEGAADWSPPGPGTWVVDRSHGPPNPTRLFRRLGSTGTAPAYRDAFRDNGAPLDTIDIQFVNGQLYRRLVPLVGAKADRGKPPPAPLLKLITRLHPAFRREERQAAHTLEHRPYLDAIARWYESERDEWIADNRRLQAVDLSTLDDAALADHLRDLDSQLVRGWYRHHRLHSYDLGPIGDLLAHTNDWGFDRVEVMTLLRGSSPATTEAADHARAIADALDAAGVEPRTVSDVESIRAVPAASEALDAYLDTYGWRLVSGYDIVGAVLNELPSAICGVVRASAGTEAATRDDDLEAELRSRCPEPESFDELLSDARAAYGVRDDNGPLTSQWPTGLTRRAYLEAGRRLASDDRIEEADHVFELDIPELVGVLLDLPDTKTAVEITERAEHRRWEGTLRGPDFLGPEPVEPDIDLLPPSLRRMMRMVTTAVDLLEPDAERNANALEGLGIGSDVYTGTARVVDDAVDAIARLEPGDVLVTPFTSPSFNAILPIAGAVVVQEGGLLCHAAVMARELDLPAVIGCLDALDTITDGDRVEVDPGSGRVRVL